MQRRRQHPDISPPGPFLALAGRLLIAADVDDSAG
jgi:hypothetical protein